MMNFEGINNEELLRSMGDSIRRLSQEDLQSMQLAIITFAYAYLYEPGARLKGIVMQRYETMAGELQQLDSLEGNIMGGADMNRGLNLLLEFQGCEKQNEVPGHYAPTQKGDVLIRYVIGRAMDDSTNN